MQGDDKNAPKHLKLKFEEFEHGFTYKRVREGQSEEDRYWTVGRVALWPNGFYLGRHFEWRVPVDDENTLSVAWFFVRVPKGREPYVQNSVPTWKSPIQGEDGRWITSHVINQDIVAWVGQGTIADRTQEHLRSSDIGITMMRNRFFEEIEAIKAGRDPKGVIRDPARRTAIDLPDMARELNTAGHHARGIPEGSAAAPAAQGIPPPLRPAARGARGVRRGDGDRRIAQSRGRRFPSHGTLNDGPRTKARQSLCLLDQEGFFLQLAGPHLVAHPARSCAAARPGELQVLLAAVLRGDFAAFQLAALGTARLTATPYAIANVGARDPSELPLKIACLLADGGGDGIA